MLRKPVNPAPAAAAVAAATKAAAVAAATKAAAVAVVIVAAAAAATKAAAAVATGVDPRHNFIRQFFLKNHAPLRAWFFACNRCDANSHH
jgi:hypothetical protein